ncbi:MAG TPA: response regulator [Chryseosolibacter sp.]
MFSSQKSFLIVDDSYIDRLVSGMLVKRTFNIHDVHEAVGGNEALEFLKTHPIPGKLIILLDIMMPRMNGFEFLEHFEKLDETTRTKIDIVILSSTFDDSDIRRGNAHPAVKKMLSKPLSANELRELML